MRDRFTSFTVPRCLAALLLLLVGLGYSRRQTAEAVRCVGIQNGHGEGPAAVFGGSHRKAGGPTGFRPSLAPQVSRRV